MRSRFARLVSPIRVEESFAGGWRIGDLAAAPGRLEVQLTHEREVPLVVELVPRGDGPRYERSRHYDIRHRNAEINVAQREALNALCQAIARNDS